MRLADTDRDGEANYLYMDVSLANMPHHSFSQRADDVAQPSGPVDYCREECTVVTGSEGENVIFADVGGDQLDDCIVVDSVTGAPTVYLNG